MKYALEGFMQERMLEYNLNGIDTYILSWLLDCTTSSRTQKKLIENKLFWNIKYSSIIEDYPILNITNTSVIANRFDKYVNTGLLVRHIERTQSGTKTWFSIQPLLRSLMYG